MAGEIQKKERNYIHSQPAGMHYVGTISFYVCTVHRWYCYFVADDNDGDVDVDGDDYLAVFFSLSMALFVFFCWPIQLLCVPSNKSINVKQTFNVKRWI